MLAAFFLAGLAGCTAQPDASARDVDALALAIAALGPEVDPAEADLAARIAIDYPLQLAEDWRVTDAPLVHNAKVLHNLRDKGLCNHWAEAMLARLRQEDFQTLSLHWSTSPPEGFRVIHHSAVISARGGDIDDGLVLDPWRHGGTLYWSRPEEDPRYEWGPAL
ncbi:hypothetical protein [Roseivivax sp. CAU 1753]